jgi:hypothetical protein
VIRQFIPDASRRHNSYALPRSQKAAGQGSAAGY